MNKLEQKAKQQRTSRNNRRFLTPLDMVIIKHDASIRKPTGHDAIFICGCGREGCAIHTSITK